MNPIELSCTCLTTLGVVGFTAYYARIASELDGARRETSRFPMFAVRDALVRLVVDERMSETDPAWRDLYRTVNFTLSMHQKLDILDFVKKYIDHVTTLQRRPELTQKLEQIMKREREAAKKVPEFDAVLRRFDEAFTHLIARRSRPAHVALAWLLVVRVKLAMITLSAGVKTARIAREAVRHPSPRDVRSWDIAASA